MKTWRTWRAWVWAVALFGGLWLAFPSLGWGQGSTSTITGTIIDTSGAAIPGAQVTLRNDNTGFSRSVVTNGEGIYRAPYLQIGNYTLTVQAKGFASLTRKDIVTTVGQVAEVNLTLKPGSISQTVTVSGAPIQLQTRTSEIGEVITPTVVKYAPLNANNFTQLATLTPGVVRGQAGSPLAGGGGLIGSGGPPQVGTEGFRFQTSGGSDLVISGLRPDQNNFMLDGVDNNEAVYSQAGIFAPPDSIQEFRITTATPPAEYGHAAGGVIDVVTKSGTNRFHGSIYDYLRNDALDARNVFDPATLSGKPNPKFPYRRDQWGGTLGGPIIHNKTFFFFDYTGFRNVYPNSTGLVTVPTALARQGNFSQYGIDVCDPATSTPYNATTNPNGCDPANPNTPGHFSSDIIPANRQDLAVSKLLNAFPLPNLPGTVNNYVADHSAVSTQFHMDLRLDQALGTDDQLMGRLTWDNLHRNSPSLFPLVPAGFGTGDELSHGRGVEVSETHIFTANLINEFHFGFLRTGVGINEPGVYGDGGLPVNYGEKMGIANSNPAPGAGGYPLIAAGDGLFSNGGFVGDGGTFQIPSDNYDFSEAMNFHAGNHDIKYGVSVIRRIANDQVGNDAKGEYVWAPWGGPTTGNSLTDMLLSVNVLPEQSWGSFGRGPLLTADERWWEMGAFVQDNFQATPNLVLNLGVRWDDYTNITEASNHLANFNLATGAMQLSNGGSLIHPDYNNFGPHVGFAYRFEKNTVLRGGYTVMYAPSLPGFNGATANLAFNPPFSGFDIPSASLTPPDPNGWGLDFHLSGGLPLFTPSINPAQPTGNVIWENPNNRTSYVESYNLSLERQVGSWLFGLAGVGNQGHKLDALRPIPVYPLVAKNDPGLGSILGWENRGNSSYNSLQIRVDKRLVHDFLWMNSYTWSHCLTDSEGMVSGEGGFGGGNFPEDTNKLYLERGNCENDIRSQLTEDLYWRLPFGRGQQFGRNWAGAVNEVLGGWQLDAMPYFGSGYHATPILGGGSGLRPNLVGNPYAPGGGKGCPTTLGTGPNMYFWNPCAFAQPAKGQDGTAGRGILVGPGRWNTDFSLIKNIPLSAFREGMGADFRLSFYNIFNHPQYFLPSPSLSGGVNADQSNGFGQISSAYSQRELELVLKIYF